MKGCSEKGNQWGSAHINFKVRYDGPPNQIANFGQDVCEKYFVGIMETCRPYKMGGWTTQYDVGGKGRTFTLSLDRK